MTRVGLKEKKIQSGKWSWRCNRMEKERCGIDLGFVTMSPNNINRQLVASSLTFDFTLFSHIVVLLLLLFTPTQSPPIIYNLLYKNNLF